MVLTGGINDCSEGTNDKGVYFSLGYFVRLFMFFMKEKSDIYPVASMIAVRAQMRSGLPWE